MGEKKNKLGTKKNLSTLQLIFFINLFYCCVVKTMFLKFSRNQKLSIYYSKCQAELEILTFIEKVGISFLWLTLDDITNVAWFNIICDH